jgi:diguanylate cyclase (GGDEF)-like protein
MRLPERRREAPAPPRAARPMAAHRAHNLLTRAYVLALVLMAATVLGTGWILNDMVARQASNARLINISGAQRMLSQRLALLAPRVANGDADQRDGSLQDFTRLLAKMQASHRELTERPDAAARRTPALARHYFGDPTQPSPAKSLDQRLRDFFSEAASLLPTAEESGADRANRIEAFRANASGPLLAALDQAVTLHQAAAGSEVDAALRFHRWAMAAALLLLAAEAIWIFRPLARRMADQARALEHDAQHDALTGLLNRRAVSQRLAAICQHQCAIAVVTIDLDWFKQTNDSEGHEGGDALLVATAERLRAAVRAGDLIGRTGGDEFSVFVLDCDGAAQANELAERIRHALHQPVDFAGRSLPLGATLGVALAPGGTNDPEVLMRLADEALLQAKLHKRGSIGQADAHDGERIQRARLIRQSIDALDATDPTASDGLSVVFQPILQQDAGGTVTGVAGVEALARWAHPTLGVLSPGEFLPVAARSGRMPALGHVLLLRGLRDFAALRAQGLDPGRLSLNLSAAELATAGFVDDFEQQVLQAGLGLSDLSLEITEEVLLDHVSPQTLGQLRALHDRGARLAMDDFGTGTSGLSQLLALPFDTLKIDRVFIQALLTEPRAQAIVSATLSMAHPLGIGVVAEGVETPPQAQALANMGCSQLQGFLCARPMAAAALADWLRAELGRGQD